jgi:hypothetical protein
MRVEPHDFDTHWRRAHPFPWARRRDGSIDPNVCFFGSSEHTTTQTQNNDPWSGQQPYLLQGFGAAQNLLNQSPPQQQNPVAGLTDAQQAALQGIIGQAQGGSPVTGAGTDFGASLLNGSYFNNPGNSYFNSLAGSNLGVNGPGSSTLNSIANGGGPGGSTLQNFANGGYFSNGYSDDTAKSIMAQVIPQVAASFNQGNSINNPQAARSAAEGVTAALAPVEYQNYQQQEQLAQNAANSLRSTGLSAASTQGANALAGGNLQAAGAQGLSGNFQDTLAKMVQGLALAPSTQALSYGDLNQLFNAGQAQQTQAQNEQSGQAATYNFSQMSPYQQLQSYMQAISGNYGGTQTSTKPYYTNDTANTLSGISGAASLAATIIPFL